MNVKDTKKGAGVLHWAIAKKNGYRPGVTTGNEPVFFKIEFCVYLYIPNLLKNN